MVQQPRTNSIPQRRIFAFKVSPSNEIINLLMETLKEKKYHFDKMTDLICDYFGLSRATIKSKSRRGEVVLARGFVIYYLYKNLNRKLLNETLVQRLIGIYLSRDRITIRYHFKQVSFLVENDKEFKTHSYNLKLKLISHDII